MNRSNDQIVTINSKGFPLKSLFVQTKGGKSKTILIAQDAILDEMLDEDDNYTSAHAKELAGKIEFYVENREFLRADWEKIVQEYSEFSLIES